MFNPLSIYYCHESNGGIGAIIYEVRNTFGEHHAYVASVEPGQADGARVCQHADKHFQVSPIIATAAGYRFTLLTALNLWAKGIDPVGRHRAPEPPGADAGYGIGGEAENSPREAAEQARAEVRR